MSFDRFKPDALIYATLVLQTGDEYSNIFEPITLKSSSPAPPLSLFRHIPIRTRHVLKPTDITRGPDMNYIEVEWRAYKHIFVRVKGDHTNFYAEVELDLHEVYLADPISRTLERVEVGGKRMVDCRFTYLVYFQVGNCRIEELLSFKRSHCRMIDFKAKCRCFIRRTSYRGLKRL